MSNKVVGFENKEWAVKITEDNGAYTVDVQTNHGIVHIICATMDEALDKYHDILDNESGSTN